MPRTSQVILGCAVAVACSVLAACGSDDPGVEKPREFSEVRLEEVRASGEGVDLEFWVTDLSPAALARALGPVAAYKSADARARVWEGNGLRLFQPPTSQARAFMASLPLQGQARRESLPMLSRWTPLSGGRRWEGGLDIWLDQQDWGLDPAAGIPISSGKLSLGTGTLRLLARSWLVAGTPDLSAQPDPRIPAAMVLQLLPQHVDREQAPDPLVGPTLTAATDQGQTFERLLMDLVCEPGQSVLIVPAHPREEWPTATGSAAHVTTTTGNEIPEVSPRPIDDAPIVEPAPAADGTPAPGPSTVGPSLPDLLTLGEAMLTDATVGRGARRRVILSITPRIPREFTPVRPLTSDPPARTGESPQSRAAGAGEHVR